MTYYFPDQTSATRAEFDQDNACISFFVNDELKAKINTGGIALNKLFAEEGVLEITNNDSNGRIEIKNDSGNAYVAFQGGTVAKPDQLLIKSPQIRYEGLQDFANQSDAETAGLYETCAYRTGGDQKIVV